jgi:hypothetical protein
VAKKLDDRTASAARAEARKLEMEARFVGAGSGGHQGRSAERSAREGSLTVSPDTLGPCPFRGSGHRCDMRQTCRHHSRMSLCDGIRYVIETSVGVRVHQRSSGQYEAPRHATLGPFALPVPGRRRGPPRATEEQRCVWRTKRAKDLNRRRAAQVHPQVTWCGPGVSGSHQCPTCSSPGLMTWPVRLVVQLVARRSPSRHCWINAGATTTEPYRVAQHSTASKPNPASRNWNRLTEFDSWTEVGIDRPAALPKADTR